MFLLRTYSTYSDKVEDDPCRVDSNPIVDATPSVSPLLLRAEHLSQSVFGPSGPRHCRLVFDDWHQSHFQGAFFFAPFFLPPRADIVLLLN